MLGDLILGAASTLRYSVVVRAFWFICVAALFLGCGGGPRCATDADCGDGQVCVGTGGVFDVKRSLIATVLFLVAAPLAAAAQQTGQGEKACCRYDQTATPGDSSFFNTFIWIINEDFPFYLSALPSDYFTFGGITIFSEDQVGGVTSQESTDGGIATVIHLTTELTMPKTHVKRTWTSRPESAVAAARSFPGETRDTRVLLLSRVGPHGLGSTHSNPRV